MNTKIHAAMEYMKRRAKLPAGDRIVTVLCEECDTPIYTWCDDPFNSTKYPHAKTCTNCKRVARENYLALNGRRRNM